MSVLGLAGHVDHGKTTLVRALTGIDTDRLPEEKARGMTTDLGFAPLILSDPDSGACFGVGLVDVPGHERYIRNMVAGAWGLDLALLAVAADDGWMPQTENHVRVLAALGVPRLAVAVTKIDRVEPGRAAAVGADAVSRAERVLGQTRVRAGFIAVSAMTGEGMGALRDVLARELAPGRTAPPLVASPMGAAPAGTSPAGAFLYVDRAFIVKGSGTVACGTLKGGPLEAGAPLLRYPGGDLVRAKALECLGTTSARVEPGSRVAVNLSHASTAVRRGDLLVAAGKDVPSVDPLLDSLADSGAGFVARFRSIPGSGEVGSGAGAPDSSRASAATARLLARGGEAEIAAGSAHAIAEVRPIAKTGILTAAVRGPFAVPRGVPAVLIRHGGAEILGVLEILRAGLPDREERRTIAKSGGLAVPSSHSSSPRSSPRQVPKPEAAFGARERAAEKLLARAGVAGMDIAPAVPGSRAGAPVGRAEMSALCEAGLAVPLGGTLFMHREAYALLVARALASLAPGETLDIGTAKSRTGFSRKFMIPFLNRMERDGFVRREGEVRVVLKAAPAPQGMPPP